MNYVNQFGESIQIAVSDEIWLNDEFIAREMDKLPPDAPRAGLAYRVSTKGQVDRNDDIPMQKIECRKFCVQHGWRITLEKAEKGVSGSKVSATKRDAIQELKAEAEKGNIYLISHHKKCGPEGSGPRDGVWGLRPQIGFFRVSSTRRCTRGRSAHSGGRGRSRRRWCRPRAGPSRTGSRWPLRRRP